LIDVIPGGTTINNYNPVGPPTLATVGMIVVKPAGGTVALTGMVAQASGRLIFFSNDGTGDLIFRHEDPASAPANRFHLPGGDDVTLSGDTDAMGVFYDTDSNRWRSSTMSSTLPQLTLTAGPLVAPAVQTGQLTTPGATILGAPFPRVSFLGAALHFVSFGGVITPPPLAAGTTNNYAPAGISGAVVVLQASNAANSTLTGIDASSGGAINPDGQVLYLYNISGGTLTLNHNDAGSAAGNRFINAAAANKVLAVGQMAMLFYDAAAFGGIGAWRVSLMT
jgi:hypothetical protein